MRDRPRPALSTPPDNEGTILTGSKTVNFGGSSQALSHVISCSFPSSIVPFPVAHPSTSVAPKPLITW